MFVNLPKLFQVSFFLMESFADQLFHYAIVAALWMVVISLFGILTYFMSWLCKRLGLGGFSTALLGLSDASRGVGLFAIMYLELLKAWVDGGLKRVTEVWAAGTGISVLVSGLSSMRLGLSQVGFRAWVVVFGVILGFGLVLLIWFRLIPSRQQHYDFCWVGD